MEPSTFVQAYAASKKSLNTWTPYCFFNNIKYGKRYIFHVLQEKSSSSSSWQFVLESMPIRLRSGRTPSECTQHTECITIAPQHRYCCNNSDVEHAFSYVRSPIFINLYVLFYHWAKYDSHNPQSDDQVVGNNHNQRDAQHGIMEEEQNLILDPNMFTIVTCLREWAHRFPLQFQGGSDWNTHPSYIFDDAQQKQTWTRAKCMETDLRELHEELLSETPPKYQTIADCSLDPITVAVYHDLLLHEYHQRVAAYQNHTYQIVSQQHELEIWKAANAAATCEIQALRHRAQRMLAKAVEIAFEGQTLAMIDGREYIVKQILQNTQIPKAWENDDDDALEQCLQNPLMPRADEPNDNITQIQQMQPMIKKENTPRQQSLQWCACLALTGQNIEQYNTTNIHTFFHHVYACDLKPHDLILIENMPSIIWEFIEIEENRLKPHSILSATASDAFTRHNVYQLRDRVLRCYGPRKTMYRIMLGNSQILRWNH